MTSTPAPVRVAGVDLGTNSVRLLVADVDPGARGGERVRDVVRRMEVVRLGEGVDRTGRFSDDALARTRDRLAEYAAVVRELGATRVGLAATSAARDARNRKALDAVVRDTLGVHPRVLTGDEEARWTFRGATARWEDDTAAPDGPYLCVDVGGGSTEFVLGSGGAVEAAVSVDIGCVRLHERHLHDDPPAPEQVQAVRADVRAALADVRAAVPVDRGATFVGLAGTMTTLAALALDLPGYDAERIDGARVSASDVRSVTARLCGLTAAGRAALPVVHPGRADVLAAGALVTDTVLEELGHEHLVVSEHDVLDGITEAVALGEL